MNNIIKKMKWILKKVANGKKLYRKDYLVADILLNQEYYGIAAFNAIDGGCDDCFLYVFCLKDADDLVEFIRDCEAGKVLTKKPFMYETGNEAPMHFVVFDDLKQLQESFAEAVRYASPDEKIYQEFLELYKTFSSVMSQIIAGKKIDDFEEYIPDVEKVIFGEDEEHYFGNLSDESE